MAVADVYNMEGKKVSEVDLDDNVFNVAVKPHVLHEVVVLQLASRRAGTAATKGRSDVRGGGQKPYRQKGTGRARAGSRSSPLWRGGGVVFGPSPRNFRYKVPKKVRRSALKMALSSKVQDKALMVLDRLDLETAKTKRFAEILSALQTDKALIIMAEKNENVELSARNLPYAKVLRSEGLNVYDILKFETVVLVESAIAQIQERLLS
jgi:large subunit ribosomal protein L4